MNFKLLEKSGFLEEATAIKEGKCPVCKEKVDYTKFRDGLSLKEFKISGLCQTCQDNVFTE